MAGPVTHSEQESQPTRQTSFRLDENLHGLGHRLHRREAVRLSQGGESFRVADAGLCRVTRALQCSVKGESLRWRHGKVRKGREEGEKGDEPTSDGAIALIEMPSGCKVGASERTTPSTPAKEDVSRRSRRRQLRPSCSSQFVRSERACRSVDVAAKPLDDRSAD